MGAYFDFRPGYLKSKPGDDFSNTGAKGGLRGQTSGGSTNQMEQWQKLGETLRHPIKATGNALKENVADPASNAWNAFKQGFTGGGQSAAAKAAIDPGGELMAGGQIGNGMAAAGSAF